MSPERKIENPFVVFPLRELSIQDATIWIQNRMPSPDMQDAERDKLKNSNPELHFYIHSLSFLRNIIQFENDPKTKRAYWNGAFFMLHALNKQYENAWIDIPDPSDDTKITHFLNQFDVENTHGALHKLSPNILSSDNYANTFTSFITRRAKKGFDPLVRTFAMNSQNNLIDLFREIPELRNSLTRTSLAQTHGPALGLVYGAFDVHELFRLHEEGQAFEHQYQIPTK